MLPLCDRAMTDLIALISDTTLTLCPSLFQTVTTQVTGATTRHSLAHHSSAQAHSARHFISVRTFLDHVNIVADWLPNNEHVINLTTNRYLFMVGFCAIIQKGQTNLLPPNRNIEVQHQLAHRYPNAYVLHDGTPVSDQLHSYSFATLPSNADTYRKKETTETPSVPRMHVPHIKANHIAAICFTSGSTGASKAINKPWGTFVTSAYVNKRYMLPTNDLLHHMLATVPPHHMWGLETTVFLPLFANICAWEGKPLFPQDVYDQLNQLPTPRVLVSTPPHLRALISTNLFPSSDNNSYNQYPPCEHILCATTPLDTKDAHLIEQTFSGELKEIYGCSEVGSLAIRRPTKVLDWQPFNCFKLNPQANTQSVTISAQHLLKPEQLQDQIQILNNGYFKLLGRSSDMIDIAGKRGSLFELNTILLKIAGVADGFVFLPDELSEKRRLAALVVLEPEAHPTPEHKKTRIAQIKAAFSAQLDPAMVPRRIIITDSLPREESGKLSKKRILEYYQAHTAE